MKTRRRAVLGLEEYGQNQVSHPTPPKTALPNPKLCERDLSRSLPERTSNMLKNLEKSHWITSYQLQYTGKEAESGIRNSRTFTCQNFSFDYQYELDGFFSSCY